MSALGYLLGLGTKCATDTDRLLFECTQRSCDTDEGEPLKQSENQWEFEPKSGNWAPHERFTASNKSLTASQKLSIACKREPTTPGAVSPAYWAQSNCPESASLVTTPVRIESTDSTELELTPGSDPFAFVGKPGVWEMVKPRIFRSTSLSRPPTPWRS